MTFKMWSIYHYLYIISPFIIFFIIYALLRKMSDKANNIVGYVLGGISVSILIIINILTIKQIIFLICIPPKNLNIFIVTYFIPI